MITQAAEAIAHKNQRSTSVGYALKITRRDAWVIAASTADVVLTVDGVDYLPRLNMSEFRSAEGLAVGNSELKTINDGEFFARQDVLNNLYDGARYDLFQFDIFNPDLWGTPISSGRLGQIHGAYTNELTIELRDWRQYFQQSIGRQKSPICTWRYGSTTRETGGFCMKDLTALTVTGTITHVVSDGRFRDDSRGEAADFFGNGDLTFTTGDNAGVTIKVAEYDFDGTFYVPLTLAHDVQVGDEYTAVAGCRKTFSDCQARENQLNHGGFPNAVNQDEVING